MSIYPGYSLNRAINLTSIYTIFDATYAADFYFTGEYHNFWEIICVLDGEIGVTSEGAVYRLARGQMILHKPMEFHRIWSERSVAPHIAIVSFAADSMPSFQSKTFLLFPDYIAMLNELVTMSKEVFEFRDIYVVGIKDDMAQKAALFTNKLEHFLLTAFSSENGSASRHPSISAKRYAMIVDVMKENLNKSLTISELASLCNMSTSNLKKTFSSYSRTGVITYFNSLKITKAIEMLSEGKRICEIAYLLGFEEQNYFSAFFKRITGYSPLYYKKRFLNSAYQATNN